MRNKTWDRIAMGLAARASRRRLLRSAGGVAALGLSGRVLLPEGAPAATVGTPAEERMIALMEQAVTAADGHLGSCADLSAKAQTFRTPLQADLRQFQAEERAWSPAQRQAHADRMRAAALKIQAAVLRCRVHDAGMTPAATPTAPATATPVARGGGPQGLAVVVDYEAAAVGTCNSNTSPIQQAACHRTSWPYNQVGALQSVPGALSSRYRLLRPLSRLQRLILRLPLSGSGSVWSVVSNWVRDAATGADDGPVCAADAPAAEPLPE